MNNNGYWDIRVIDGKKLAVFDDFRRCREDVYTEEGLEEILNRVKNNRDHYATEKAYYDDVTHFQEGLSFLKYENH